MIETLIPHPRRVEISRPDWDTYFLAIAFLASSRSHDAETHHGCVIATQDHRILSIGYNGFPRGIDDSLLPNIRPDKYPHLLHSERNSLANCEVRPKDCVAYVTGQCCFDCTAALYQHGISEIVMFDGYGSVLSDDESLRLEKQLQKLAPLRIKKVSPNFDFIRSIKAFFPHGS